MTDEMNIVQALRELAEICPDGDETLVDDGGETIDIATLIDNILLNCDYDDLPVEYYVVEAPDTPFNQCGGITRLDDNGYRESMLMYEVVDDKKLFIPTSHAGFYTCRVCGCSVASTPSLIDDEECPNGCNVEAL